MIGLGVAAAIVVVALIAMASWLSNIFGDVGGGIDGDQLGLNPPSTSQPSGGIRRRRETCSRHRLFPAGGADTPGLADKAIDGDPATMWPTDTYSDPLRSRASRTVSA